MSKPRRPDRHAGRPARGRVPAALLAALLLAAATILGACGSGDDDGSEDGAGGGSGGGDAIRIGSLFSTTGDGVAFGPQQLQAAELAVDRVNQEAGDDGEAGGDGVELELVQRDDESDSTTSAALMRELIVDEEVQAVLGPTFSNSAALAHPVADGLGTPVLAVSNTGPGIVGECEYSCELIFRDSLGEEAALPAVVDTVLGEPGGDRIETAVVAYPEADPFGMQTSDIARDALEAGGVAEVTRTGGGWAIPVAIRAEPDLLMITASSGEKAAEMLAEARELGFEGPILGGNAFNSRRAAQEAGSAGEGARSAAAWYLDNEAPANTEFVEAYREAYDEDPDQFAAQAYTGVLLLAEAARQAAAGNGDGGDSAGDLAEQRQALAEALAEVELQTPLGPFAFTPDHDVIQPIWIVEMNGQGTYTLVEKIAP
ncbi:MAG TPA: ABC transporter substrate-binding protein [Solirubrobacterales bacterium]|nr:ABC transporter substrate-binding protein [Solirubrobacterales bacterium]